MKMFKCFGNLFYPCLPNRVSSKVLLEAMTSENLLWSSSDLCQEAVSEWRLQTESKCKSNLSHCIHSSKPSYLTLACSAGVPNSSHPTLFSLLAWQLLLLNPYFIIQLIITWILYSVSHWNISSLKKWIFVYSPPIAPNGAWYIGKSSINARWKWIVQESPIQEIFLCTHCVLYSTLNDVYTYMYLKFLFFDSRL